MQFRRGEGRLRRSAAAEHDDLLQPRAADRLDRRVRCVRGCELLRSQRQHARDVEGDVSVPDHDRALDVEVEREVLVVGMAVVPGDELGRGPRTREVLAGDGEPPVALRADGVDHGVVEADEVGVVEVAADLDVADEAEPRTVGDLLERARDALQLRVVGRDPEPDEPPRRRQPLDHVHLDGLLGSEQRAGGVEAGRPRADHGDAQGTSAHGADARRGSQGDTPVSDTNAS